MLSTFDYLLDFKGKILFLALYRYIFHPNNIKNVRANNLPQNVMNDTQLNDPDFAVISNPPVNSVKLLIAFGILN